MAQRIGIRQWTEQRIISGARVAFDPRPTEKVDSTRDGQNYKTLQGPMRKAFWEWKRRERQAAE